MLFRVLVNNLFKEIFYKKREKNNILIVFFFISHKNGINTFLKWIVN